METKSFLNDFAKTIFILFLCVIVSFALNEINMREENIMMVYLTGVLLVIVETKKFVWGIASSILCIFIFNYLYTDPKYTFMINDPNYILTLLIFLIVSFIASTLTSKLQRHAQFANENEKQTKNLYEISKNFLNISGIDNIAEYGMETLLKVSCFRSVTYLAKDFSHDLRRYLIEGHYKNPDVIENDTPAKWCYANITPCGCGTAYYSISRWKYIPIKTSNRILGVLGIYCESEEPSPKQMIFINTVVSQMAMAVDKEFLYLQQEQDRIEIEKEKLRNNLLRSISHDLRTPLTGIAGSTSFIMESYDQLDKETVLSLLSDIGNDVTWLNNLVENLLNMTRIQEGKLMIKKVNEVVDDIVSEASTRISKTLKSRNLHVSMPQDVLLAPMDGKLIIQVLVNILDNALKHTKDGADIYLDVYQENATVIFKISDNGGGIRAELADTLFESFVTSQGERSDSHRGIGLGLSICKSIIEAHNGRIKAYNNKIGGATFEFFLPLQ